MITAHAELLPRIPRWVGIAGVSLAIAAVAAWLGRFAPTAPLMAAAAVVLLLATMADLRVGLAGIVFAILLSPEAGGSVYVRADDVILGAVAFGWLARRAVHRDPLRENPLLAPMGLLLVAGLASLAAALALGGVDPFTTQPVSPIIAGLHWLKRAEYFLIVLLVAQTLRTRSEVALFSGLLLGVAAAVAAHGAIRVALEAGEPGFRLDAPFDTGQANTFGEYLMLTLALALGLLVHSARPRQRVLLIGVVAACALAFPFTFSRGSYVGLAIAILVIALLRDPRLLLVVAALALVVPPHLPADVTARLGSIPHEVRTLDSSDGGGNALLARIDSYRVAARRVGERPLLGYGPGVVALDRIESQYAKEAVDGGLIGLGLFLWFLGRAARLGRGILAGARERLDRGIGTGYVAGVAGMAVAGLGAIPFTTIRTMEAFCFATGLVIVLGRLQREEARQGVEAG